MDDNNSPNEEEPDVFSDMSPKIGNSHSMSGDVIDVLAPNEIRWFYSSPKKTWIPFLGFDSLRIEIAYRQFHSSLKGMNFEHYETISVRGDLYEVDIIKKKCSPIYWIGDSVDVMRGTWFFDVGWQPLDEEYAMQIEIEHLSKFAGWKSQDFYVPNKNKYESSKKFSISPFSTNKNGTKDRESRRKSTKTHITPLKVNNLESSNENTSSFFNNQGNMYTDQTANFEVPTQSSTASSSPIIERRPPNILIKPEDDNFTVNDAEDNTLTDNLRKDIIKKKKTGNYNSPIHTLKFKDFYVEWFSPSEVYMFSLATSSKLYRSLTYALGFQKTGIRLNRGYCIQANDSDKPPEIQHMVFVIHGIGAKLDSSKCIRNCGVMRDLAAKVKCQCFKEKSPGSEIRAEFFPIEWRANLKLDDGAVDMISPKNVIGLRSILNTTVMDIMYYTSPIFRNEILTGVQNELNRLYQMFCQRHPNFSKNPEVYKVSIIAHSLGSVIIHDILSGWNPSYIHQNYVDQTLNECIEQADETDKQKWSKFAENLKAQVVDIEKKLNYIRKDRNNLKFKVENLFLLGSPLAVFLVMRGISIYGRGLNAANNISDINIISNINNLNSRGDVKQDLQKHTIIPHPILPQPSQLSSQNTETLNNHTLTTNLELNTQGNVNTFQSSVNENLTNHNLPEESLQRELERMDKAANKTSTPKSILQQKIAPNQEKQCANATNLSSHDDPIKTPTNPFSSIELAVINSNSNNSTDADHKKHEKHFYKPKISVLLPKNICGHVYNIYHPADPVAYRLEPLISLKYIRVKPVLLRADITSKSLSEVDPLELYPDDLPPQPNTTTLESATIASETCTEQQSPDKSTNSSLPPPVPPPPHLRPRVPPPPPRSYSHDLDQPIYNRCHLPNMNNKPERPIPPVPFVAMQDKMLTNSNIVIKASSSMGTFTSPPTTTNIQSSSPLQARHMPSLSDALPGIGQQSSHNIVEFSELPYEGLKLKYFTSEHERLPSSQRNDDDDNPLITADTCESFVPPNIENLNTLPPTIMSITTSPTSTSTSYYNYIPRASLDFIRGYLYRSSSSDKGSCSMREIPDERYLDNTCAGGIETSDNHPIIPNNISYSPSTTATTTIKITLEHTNTHHPELVKIKYYNHAHKCSQSSNKHTDSGQSSDEEGILMLNENGDELKIDENCGNTSKFFSPSTGVAQIRISETNKRKSIASKFAENLIKRDLSNSKKQQAESSQAPTSNDSKNDVYLEDIPKLEYRVDYTLPAGWSFVNTYVSAITAHTSYWNNPDIINFIMQHLFPDEKY